MTKEERQTPGILFACRESRGETRKLFELCFEKAAAASPTALRPAVYVNFAIDVFILIPRKNCTTSTVNRIPSLESFNFSSDVVFRIRHYHTSCEVGKGAGGFPWRTNSFLGYAMLNEGSLQDIKFRLLQSSKEFAVDPSILPGIIRDNRKYINYHNDLFLAGFIKRKAEFYYSPVIWLKEPKSSST